MYQLQLLYCKVTRDKIMVNKNKKNNRYKWDKNKAYGTKDHLLAIKIWYNIFS